jgi:hypothetical protein
VSSFLGFLGVSFAVIATPGPDTAITIRNTLIGRRAGGVLTALAAAARTPYESPFGRLYLSFRKLHQVARVGHRLDFKRQHRTP